jgi:hypothetical protein
LHNSEIIKLICRASVDSYFDTDEMMSDELCKCFNYKNSAKHHNCS